VSGGQINVNIMGATLLEWGEVTYSTRGEVRALPGAEIRAGANARSSPHVEKQH